MNMVTPPILDERGIKSRIAKSLGISHQAVQKWERVPPGRVIQVCDALQWDVTPHQLRPDLYPHPADGMPKRRRKSAA